MQHLLSALARRATGRITRQVVVDEGVNPALRGRQAEWSVAPRTFSSPQLLRCTGHAHHEDGVRQEHVQTVQKPPRLAQHVVHDYVVPRVSHPPDRTMKASPHDRAAPNESTDKWKNGVGSTSSSARANADLPELEVPLRRMMRPPMTTPT